MKKNSQSIYEEVEALFSRIPTTNQKAWGLINDFYHLVLTFMEKNNISQADLARMLGKSRSAISQMFNKTPNISIKKMAEIADAIGLTIKITTPEKAEEDGLKIFFVVNPSFRQSVTTERQKYVEIYDLDQQGQIADTMQKSYVSMGN